MANWYCDYTNGNDTTGSGTSGNPYKTVQKCVNVATGGDTIFIANTSAQILTSAISWTGGWTADNTKYTRFASWNNGGSITVQKPNEASPRVGATIDGNGVSVFILNTSSLPEKLCFENIRFQGHDVGANPYMFVTGTQHQFKGCVFNGGGVASSIIYGLGSEKQNYDNNYFYNCVNSGYPMIDFNDGTFVNNYVDVTFNNSARSAINCIGVVSNVFNNIIKVSGACKAISFGNYSNILSNTIIGDSSANQTGLYSIGIGSQAIFNNILYKFNGTSSIPVDIDSTIVTFGFNAYFDCNANSVPTSIAMDLTTNDVAGSGDPFVNSAGDDYSVTGSTAENAGLGSNFNIGAVQELSGGGGGGSATVAYAFMG